MLYKSVIRRVLPERVIQTSVSRHPGINGMLYT